MADKKVTNGVVVLSSAAVLAIYGVGYARTREAADRFAQQAAERHPRIPSPRAETRRRAVEEAPQLQADELAPPDTVKARTSKEDETSERAPRTVHAAAAEASAKSPSVNVQTPIGKPSRPETTIASNVSITPALSDEDGTGAAVSTPAPGASAAPAQPAAAATPSPAPAAAQAPIPAPSTAAPVEQAKAGYKDGTYYGWGSCRHGDIQAAVIIEEGKITAARVERCLTRYSCNWITPIPPRILVKQGTTYDYVSGATESSDAFQDAVAEALSQAK